MWDIIISISPNSSVDTSPTSALTSPELSISSLDSSDEELPSALGWPVSLLFHYAV